MLGRAIPRRKHAQGVIERLLEVIQSGTLEPGIRPPSERQLMSMFEVGRPAVRKALQKLERMGLIAITHGVPPTGDSSLGEVHQSSLRVRR